MKANALIAGLLASIFLLGAPVLSQAASEDHHQVVHKHHRVIHRVYHMRRGHLHHYLYWRHGHFHKAPYVQLKPRHPF